MKNNILETIKKEIRGIVRDKKSLLMMVLTPLMIPMFIFIFSYIYDGIINDTEVTIYSVGVNYKIDDEQLKIIKNVNLNSIYYSNEEELKEAYDNGEISSYIMKIDNKYLIYFNNKKQDSSNASYNISLYLDNYNNYLGQTYLIEKGVDIDNVYNNISYEYKELTGKNDLVNEIINMGLIFAIMAITLTAIYSATDTTAGEKERGTLETFLTFPIKSSELIIGKYLAISISCVITSIISLILAISSLIISKEIFSIYATSPLNLNVINIILVMLILFSYSFFISGLCIAIASFSKTYKEAQSSLTPISLFVMAPMFLDIMGVSLSPIISLIPMINHSLLINDIFNGNINVINIIIMFISTIIYVIVLIKYITKQYTSEKILFSD